MSKGLEALNRLFSKIKNPQLEEENDFYDIYECLKALEIIKDKLSPIALTTFYPMTQEEFELVKEVLL